MPSLDLILQPLKPDAFAPFGDVIEVGPQNRMIPINYGLTVRHHDLARIDVNAGGGRASMSIFRTQAVTLPFEVKIMERHPLGSQAFVMMTDNPYLIVVAPAGEFDATQLCAFRAEPGQGVNYHKGVWHHYCLGLNNVNDFLVVDREGEGDNCEEIELPEDLIVTLN